MKNIKLAATILSATLILSSFSIYSFASQNDDSSKTQSQTTSKKYEFLLGENCNLGTHIFELIKNEKTSYAFVKGDDYNVIIEGKDVLDIDKKIERYSIKADVIREENKKIDKLIGRGVPHYLMEISDENGLPAAATYDMHKTSFCPNSTVSLYKLNDNDTDMELLQKDIKVDENRNITFKVPSGGRYLLVGATNNAAVNPYDYERPQIFNIDELITFEDNYFKLDDSDLIK